MPLIKKIIWILVIIVIVGGAAYFLKQKLFPESYRNAMINAFHSGPKTVTSNQTAVEQPQYIRTCPVVSNLVKSGQFWTADNGNWKCFSESLSNKIKTFIGAQWVGVKVGKIICLYQPEEEMSFPIALEMVHDELILEPRGNNWSATVTDRRLCKSVNVEDCAFYLQPRPDTSNIYQGLEYTGSKRDNFE